MYKFKNYFELIKKTFFFYNKKSIIVGFDNLTRSSSKGSYTSLLEEACVLGLLMFFIFNGTDDMLFALFFIIS